MLNAKIDNKIVIMKRIMAYRGLLFALNMIFFYPLFSQNSALASTEAIRDCVLNKKKAISIAEPIWVKAFGQSVYKRKPFIATLNTSGIWIVKGTLNAKRGGVPYIEIRKRDCAILRVWHSR
jgi:hypothetical protein